MCGCAARIHSTVHRASLYNHTAERTKRRIINFVPPTRARCRYEARWLTNSRGAVSSHIDVFFFNSKTSEYLKMV